MSFAAMMLVAALVDALVGWPPAVFSRIGHPVTWLGRLITAFEAAFNNGASWRRLIAGGGLVALCLTVCILPAFALHKLLPEGWMGLLFGGLIAWPFLALRSMYDHVADVSKPLVAGDMEAARRAVSMIVGRDPAQLDEAGTARAALESLAENTSDGIVAPVFWGVIAGLPGLVAYKAINTLDSMIGHRNDRYEAFGKIAARLDDVVNLVPARLTGLLFACAAPHCFGASLRVMWRDARQHRSPNAGWPEGAMAGVLGVRLSGPRSYGASVVQEPWVNAEGRDAVALDLRRALSLYRRAMALLMLALLALSLL